MSPAASNPVSFQDVPGEPQSSLLSASHLGHGKGPGVCTAHILGNRKLMPLIANQLPQFHGLSVEEAHIAPS